MAKGKHIAQHGRPVHAQSIGRGRHTIAMVNPMHHALKAVSVALAAVLVVGCAGIGFASAGNYAVATLSGSASNNGEPAAVEQTTFSSSNSSSSSERFILETSATRDVSAGVAEIEAEEEAARILAEERRRTGELQAIERAQVNQQRSAANGGVGVYDIDFNVGHDAFVNEWSGRIDRYLEGTTLAGYGTAFAEAAWKHGVDPRWSPAISHTESGNGAHCFASHNAWGWTGGAWGSWESAINAHVSGLSLIYGFTISYSNASRYCPPNTDYWYSNTLREMSKI